MRYMGKRTGMETVCEQLKIRDAVSNKSKQEICEIIVENKEKMDVAFDPALTDNEPLLPRAKASADLPVFLLNNARLINVLASEEMKAEWTVKAATLPRQALDEGIKSGQRFFWETMRHYNSKNDNFDAPRYLLGNLAVFQEIQDAAVFKPLTESQIKAGYDKLVRLYRTALAKSWESGSHGEYDAAKNFKGKGFEGMRPYLLYFREFLLEAGAFVSVLVVELCCLMTHTPVNVLFIAGNDITQAALADLPEDTFTESTGGASKQLTIAPTPASGPGKRKVSPKNGGAAAKRSAAREAGNNHLESLAKSSASRSSAFSAMQATQKISEFAKLERDNDADIAKAKEAQTNARKIVRRHMKAQHPDASKSEIKKYEHELFKHVERARNGPGMSQGTHASLDSLDSVYLEASKYLDQEAAIKDLEKKRDYYVKQQKEAKAALSNADSTKKSTDPPQDSDDDEDDWA